jgi:glutathione S-transferase
MVNYKLFYFNFGGRAEFIRLLFAYAGQAYEDVRFENSEWSQVKQQAPMGKAPFLEVCDGSSKHVICQSTTIGICFFYHTISAIFRVEILFSFDEI